MFMTTTGDIQFVEMQAIFLYLYKMVNLSWQPVVRIDRYQVSTNTCPAHDSDPTRVKTHGIL